MQVAVLPGRSFDREAGLALDERVRVGDQRSDCGRHGLEVVPNSAQMRGAECSLTRQGFSGGCELQRADRESHAFLRLQGQGRDLRWIRTQATPGPDHLNEEVDGVRQKREGSRGSSRQRLVREGKAQDYGRNDRFS
jgi:hypothetical protein